LAQSFEKDFDAPAVVVVGHQSSGKSALIEALMGFQFNQVGGGTKTRRPIALQMKYNPEYAIEPKCYLELPNGKEEERTLAQIQDYIEQENQRLEKDPIRSFDRREIKIRMEYKHCPNLILIDTPGLIAAPKIVGRGARAGREVAQQRALHKSAQDAERLVVEKISCPDYLIVCVEDTADWKHGPTREVVQKADPDLSRTIVVNTKLDTKLPQFGSPKDTVEFLQASILDRTSPQRLGGPFYTSIPSGRVQDDGLFDENEEFVLACQDVQLKDWATIRNAIKRSNSGSGTNKNSHHNTKIKIGESLDLMQSRVGLTQLRTYLEEKVDETYRANVNKILPMLREEQKTAERKLERIEKELDSISLERLKAGAETFCDDFCQALRKSLQGSIVAPSNVFGETLSQEASTSGVDFHNVPNSPMAVSDRTWERLVRDEVGHSQHRLYGGSQYHRCLREFNLATKCLRLPTITEDEIANAAGVGDTHDGVNFLHAACTIALQKARDSFEPMLEAFRVRVMHVMERLCPVAEYVIQNNQEWHHRTTKFFDHVDTNGDGRLSKNDVASNPQFRQLVRKVFEKFVRKCSDSALVKCQDDLTAITRYVTWNMDQGASGSLQRSLPDQMDLVHVYKVALKASGKDDSSASSSGVGAGGSASSSATSGVSNGSGSDASAPHLQLSSERTLRPISDSQDERDHSNLLQLMEEAICSRNTKRTNMVVGSLVQHIVTGWRESFGRTVTMKFNCYFMLPFINDFHKFMRDELQAFYDNPDGEATDVFDLQLARRALQMRRSELVNELHANTRLQAKFVKLSDVMNKRHSQQQSSMKLDSFDF